MAIRAGKKRAIRLKNKLAGLMQNTWIELLVRWFIGALFVFASYHKILDPAHFAKIIYGYYLFPDVSINLIAIILPHVELFCGLALILGIYPRSACLIINLMLLGFIIAIGINLLRGHQFDCGCFSMEANKAANSAIYILGRNIILLIFGAYIFMYGLDKPRLSVFMKA
jgi:putative oxidoreductase